MREAKLDLDAAPGESVTDFAARMVFLAWACCAEVTGRHNDHALIARRGMTRNQVLEPWNRAVFDSYFGDGEWDRRRSMGIIQ
ncbi:MAG: hypothetical protein KAY22_22850 [Rhizorhabdus sp.]|uniref:hypothetical protein n=1 Tax=Rhizorhabdus sp. TaxID=1968843 RepID=UPI001B5E3C4C|nr:hypothetical protein [Rhizorhabdus sp.]MBP8235141.1 hypothetical protein [Rhizorhabdus sp.]